MEPAMEIFRRGRGCVCYYGDCDDGQGLVGFTSEQLISEGEIWIKERAHTHGWIFRNVLTHNTCTALCVCMSTETNPNTHMNKHTPANPFMHIHTHKLHTQFSTDSSPYRSFRPLLPVFYHLYSFAFNVSHPSLHPSLCCVFSAGFVFSSPHSDANFCCNQKRRA